MLCSFALNCGREVELFKYSTIEKSPLSSGILYDLVVPISGLQDNDGTNDSAVVRVEQWLQMSHELLQASLLPSEIPSDSELRRMGNREARNRIYPIVFLDYRYQRVLPNANVEEAIAFDSGRIMSINDQAFEERRVFAASTLRDWSYRGSDVLFRIDQQSF